MKRLFFHGLIGIILISVPLSATSQVKEIKIVDLEGSGYELGLQHGRELKTEIEDLVTKWRAYTSRLGDVEEILDDFFEYADFTDAINKWTPELLAEIEGIADGSGQKFRDIYIHSLIDEFWVWLESRNRHHCSGLGVPARNGNPGYIAQNMDIESYTNGHQTILRIKGLNGKPDQMVLSYPGLIGLTGLNDEGIGVCVNTIMQVKACSDGLPVAFVIRGILARKEKSEVMSFVQSVKHASGQNYLIGIKGEVFDLEASANKVVRFDPQNENGAVYHTNHPIVNDDLKDWHAEGIIKLKEEGRLKNTNSYLRLDALVSRVSGSVQVDEELFKDALRSKDDENSPVCNPLLPNRSGFTFASIIMQHSGKPYIQVTAGPPDESEYVKITFTDL